MINNRRQKFSSISAEQCPGIKPLAGSLSLTIHIFNWQDLKKQPCYVSYWIISQVFFFAISIPLNKKTNFYLLYIYEHQALPKTGISGISKLISCGGSKPQNQIFQEFIKIGLCTD